MASAPDAHDRQPETKDSSSLPEKSAFDVNGPAEGKESLRQDDRADPKPKPTGSPQLPEKSAFNVNDPAGDSDSGDD